MINYADSFTVYSKIDAALLMPSSQEFFSENDLKAVKVGNYSVAPWGEDNALPDKIVELSEKSDVVSSNLLFNTSVAYGLGPKPMRYTRDESGKIIGSEEINEGPIYDFFEDNDIGLFLLEQLTDINYFYNSFVEVILSNDMKNIVSLRSKEAVFSRWETMDKKGIINNHFYSAKWGTGAKQNEIVKTPVLDERNPYLDLCEMLKAGKKDYRYIVPVFMPSPGRPYYPKSPWWSIFENGWYDHSVIIPAYKNTILKNKLGVKYIIYVSEEYLKDVLSHEGIDRNDQKAVNECYARQRKMFNDFLTGSENVGKSIMALKKYALTSTGSAEHKYIEIIPIKNDLSGGELIDDSEEASNHICYAMGIHPSLIGATPGKSNNTSGTDKRELYMIKQALTKPVLDRVLRVFKFIKKFNNWEKDFFVSVPEWLFTTLDKNKTGKEVKE